MTKASIIVAITGGLLMLSPEGAVAADSSQQMEPEKVVVRSDNKIADKEGQIIAVPNLSDPRNSDYEKYYVNTSKACGAGQGCESDFFIIADKDKGYMKMPLNVVRGDGSSPVQDLPPVPGMVTNYGKTKIIVDERKGPYGGDPSMSARY